MGRHEDFELIDFALILLSQDLRNYSWAPRGFPQHPAGCRQDGGAPGCVSPVSDVASLHSLHSS